MYQVVVQALACDARAEALWDLAREIVESVFNSGVEWVIEHAVAAPDIEELCQQFRDEAADLGYDMPDSDTDLYTNVIRPLHLAQVHEGR